VEFQNADQLIRKLSVLDTVEATKRLTEFYAKARFRIASDDFRRQLTDGSDDGEIDFYHREDSTSFIFQSKYTAPPKRTNASDILKELGKLKKTIASENTNHRAADFVNALRRDFSSKSAFLEILWLTTNVIEQSTRDEVQRELDKWRKHNRWSLGIDFVAIDKRALDSVRCC
jgi:hypothetical protein